MKIFSDFQTSLLYLGIIYKALITIVLDERDGKKVIHQTSINSELTKQVILI